MNHPYTCVCGHEFSDERYLEQHQTHHCPQARKQAESAVHAYSEQAWISTSTGEKRGASHLQSDNERQLQNARFLGPSKHWARSRKPAILGNGGSLTPNSLPESPMAVCVHFLALSLSLLNLSFKPSLDESSMFPSDSEMPNTPESTSALPQRRVRHLTEQARAMLVLRTQYTNFYSRSSHMTRLYLCWLVIDSVTSLTHL